MRQAWKALYTLSRQLGLMGLPLLRGLRNAVYARHLGAPGIRVGDFVVIHPAHPPQRPSLFGRGLHVSRLAGIDLTGGVTIGDRVTVSEGARIYSHDHVIDGGGGDWRRNGIAASPLVIEDDAWIGAGATVLASVGRIGRGAVVAAGAVVADDVPDLAVVGGVPAKLLRMRRLGDAQGART